MNQRYQPPNGDIWAKIKAQYGVDAANKVARADASSDPHAVTDAIAEIRNGPKVNDSFWSALGDQLSDPLAAPLDGVNSQIDNAVKSVFRNPWVVFAIVLFAFFQLGGFPWLRKQFA